MNVAPKQAGTNQIWDWSTLSDSSRTDTVMVSVAQNQPYQSEFPGANVSLNTAFRQGPLNETVRIYGINSAAGFREAGYKLVYSITFGGATLNQRSVRRNLSQDNHYRWPLEYPQNYTINVNEIDSSFTLTTAGSQVINEERSYTITTGNETMRAIGWGTLKLRTGDVPAILYEVDKNITIADFDWNNSTGTYDASTPFNRLNKEFVWLSTDGALEVASVRMLNNRTTVIANAKYTRLGTTTSLSNNTMLTSLSAYPVPCTDVLNIKAPEDFNGSAVVYDSKGVALQEISVSNGMGSLSMHVLSAGMYWVVVKNQSGIPVASRQVPKL